MKMQSAFFDRHSKIQAVFMNGDNMTQYFPESYKEATIFVTKTAALSSDDYKYLFQLNRLEKLLIRDRSNIAYDLYLYNLKALQLSVRPHSYMQLQARPFVLALPSVKLFNLEIEDLTRQQAIEFTKNQNLPENYKINIAYTARTVQILRVG